MRKKLTEKGITLLEGLVSTAIIGIGFIAVFQMVQYSVRSIDVSGERTKANYIAGTFAEDVYAFKNQETSNKKFIDLLKDNEWKSEKCEAKDAHTFNESTANDNIRKKWLSRVSKNYLKCVDNSDQKFWIEYNEIFNGLGPKKPRISEDFYNLNKSLFEA